ncbi:MAG: alpha-glucoside transport system permease protein [Verrucomicrobiales bacterium]|jgi:alpha-glucoside transport system permease protein
MMRLDWAQWASFGLVFGAIVGYIAATIDPRSTMWPIIRGVLLLALLAGVGVSIIVDPLSYDRVASTMFVVICAIGLIGGTWVLMNLIADQARFGWSRFMGLVCGVVAVISFSMLRGNLVVTSLVRPEDPILRGAGSGTAGRLEWPIFGLLVWGVGVFVMTSLPNRVARVSLGAALGAISGYMIGSNLQVWHRPEIHWGNALIGILIGIAIAAGISRLRGKTSTIELAPAAMVGAFLGWIATVWLGGNWHTLLGSGPERDAAIATIIPLSLLGMRLGINVAPRGGTLARFDNRMRAFIFLGPAMLFLSAALVIPAVRTIILSFKDRRSEEWVWFDNYTELLTDDDSFDLSNWRSLFTSDLYLLGMLLIGAGLLIGLIANSRRNRVGLIDGSRGSIVLLLVASITFVAGLWSTLRSTSLTQFTSIPWFIPVIALIVLLGIAGISLTGRVESFGNFERTGASIGAIIFGLFLFAFGVLSVIRGTFFNNIWWVITVTTLSVVLGLMIAVLAERAGSTETVAKALIFMPMAVSFVGASIVWRLQYQPRFPATETQTSVLNATWVQLGRLSFAGWPRVLALVILAGVLGLLVRSGIRRVKSGKAFSAQVGGIIVFGYLFIELARRSLGGFKLSNGEYAGPDIVRFLNDGPFNNVYMMVILIWIQTGFAMVILAAAIKAVPTEFIEAAKVDGATESQTFFRVTMPQILPTIGVVSTTLIVLVTKVFDIVKVTTGGNFGTNVLANDMFEVSFSFFNTGLGSAISVFILISVLPVMFLNVRRMQKERVVNR